MSALKGFKARQATERLALAPPVALQRASEDMRSYALKREALRGGLITEDEARAYSCMLRLTAGHALLARPWQPP